MADVNIADASPADELYQGTRSLESLTDQERAEWLKTGTPPAAAPAKPADPPPAKPAKQAQEPENGNPAGKGQRLKQRSTELDTEIQDLEQKLARRNELRRQLEDGEKPPAAASPAAAKPAETKQEELKPPVKPRQEDFSRFEDYEDARDKYYEDVADYKAAKRLENYRSQVEAESKQRTEAQAADTAAQNFNKRVEATAERSGTERWEKAANAIKPLTNLQEHPESAFASGFFLDSEQGAEMLLYYGEHLDEFKELLSLDARTQHKRLSVKEYQLSENPASKPRRTEAPQPPAPKRDTEVPPPPRNIQARNQAVPDPLQDALEKDDFTAFQKAYNDSSLASGHKRR